MLTFYDVPCNFFHACTGNSWWVLSSCVYICFIVTLRTNNYNHQFCIACNFFKHKYKLSGGGNCIRKLYELYSIMLVLFFLYKRVFCSQVSMLAINIYEPFYIQICITHEIYVLKWINELHVLACSIQLLQIR